MGSSIWAPGGVVEAVVFLLGKFEEIAFQHSRSFSGAARPLEQVSCSDLGGERGGLP